MSRSKGYFTVLVLVLVCGGRSARADEGMWLFNRFPKQLVEKKYGFSPADSFLDRIRLSSTRLNNGGSGSFVSPNGLIFTNHHVASDCIQKLSTAEHNYMEEGFYAASEAEEKACPDLEVNVLLKIDDVTARVTAGIPESTPSAEVNRLRKAAMTRIEKECVDATGNRCDVVTLYSGGEYDLYQYKKYTDIRLVFAPEVDIAAFGGDPDNFTYPRFCLDFAFFRAYENDQPARTPVHLTWSRSGVKEGELTFVAGHPAATGRLATVAELEFSRDVSYPIVLERLESLIRALEAYSARSEEDRRVARDNLFSVQNSFKAYTGFLAGLRDAKLMERKRDEEKRLREAVADDPAKQEKFGNIWDGVAAAYKEYAGFYKRYWLLERNPALGSDLLNLARTILRYPEEKAKPNEQRFREYADSALASLEQSMYSEAPIHDSMEKAVLAEYFSFLREKLGADDTIVKAVLAGKTPAEAASEYVSTSKLKEAAERKRLAASLEAVHASQDGMIRLARILDGPARQFRRQYEDRVEAVLNTSAARVAQARFAVFGVNEYPDATFTLRLSYGPVKGYRDNGGRPVPWATNFDGLFRRAKGEAPYELPAQWLKGKSALNLKTPFDFVTTHDTHGGNSGSPTINRRGEVVGILFDGNLEGLPNRFVFTDEQARSVHVASQAIVEALDKIYKAGRLLRELGVADR